MVNFANRLKEVMLMKQINVTELSNMSGINKGTISNYRNGKYEPRQNVVTKLALILNVDEAWLMGYDVPMKNVKKEEMENCLKFVATIQLCGVYTNATKTTVLPTSDKDSYFYLVARDNNLFLTSRIKENDLLLINKTKEVKQNDIVVVKEDGRDYQIGKYRLINRVKYLLTDNEEIVLMPTQVVIGKVVRIETNL
jgi:transcriptional regulator with XRE-family HTH domain